MGNVLLTSEIQKLPICDASSSFHRKKMPEKASIKTVSENFIFPGNDFMTEAGSYPEIYIVSCLGFSYFTYNSHGISLHLLRSCCANTCQDMNTLH